MFAMTMRMPVPVVMAVIVMSVQAFRHQWEHQPVFCACKSFR
jgi:hypothetical protein